MLPVAPSPGSSAADRLTVLVTGGAGFIGSHVVDRLLAAGHRVRIFDLRSSPHHPPSVAATVRGDLRDLPRLTEAMRGCDAVIHLAAVADVDEAQAEPVEAEARNARGTLHVLEAARRCGVRRVLYASTIWVYSDTPGERPVEEMPLHPPAHLYTATKLTGELYCHSYGELYGVEHTVLRFGIPYGPRARPAAVVPAFVARALAGQPLVIAGDGRQSRRFVYVEDLADGVVRALAPAAANRTYNLVGEEDITVAEIAAAVAEVVGDVRIEHVPGRTGDFAGAPVSGERAARELGWRPTTPFREGLRRYVDWHRATTEPEGVAHRREIAAARALGLLVRRGAVALAWAAAAAAVLIGLASLSPVDGALDRDVVFADTLVVLLPLILTAGFAWDAAGGRRLRASLWTISALCAATVVSPWPPMVDRVGHAHTVLLGLLAITAALAARLAGPSPLLRLWPATAGE